MEIDTRFPTRLNTVSDAPEPLRGALAEGLPSGEPIHLLVYAPAFSTEDEISPATVLAVTGNGWIIASETGDGGVTVEKADFANTLFLELTAILLLGQLRIAFAGADASLSVTIKFETVGDDLYREAIDLILAGIDPALHAVDETDQGERATFETWPMKFRNEAQRYRPGGQRLLAALQWPVIFNEVRQELAPAGALLITAREIVLISEQKKSSAEYAEQASSKADPVGPFAEEEAGGTITFFPRVRLADFQVSHQEQLGVLALQVHAAHGGERLEISFPSDEEKAVLKAMKQVLPSTGSSS
jgi:hypothetical protein